MSQENLQKQQFQEQQPSTVKEMGLEEIIQISNKIGLEYVEKRKEAERLELLRTSIRAKIMNCLELKNEKIPEARLKRLAEADFEYIDLLEKIATARAEAEKLKIRYDSYKSLFDARRTMISYKKVELKNFMRNLFWVDMEMSGLIPEKHRILEVALIVTNMKFETLHTYETVVYQDTSVLLEMDEWCTLHHKESGLTAKVAEGKREGDVAQELVKILRKFSPAGKAIIAGNSIGQDRKFIDKWMPEVASMLHYRMLDVSSFKIIFEEIFQKRFAKNKKHRAIDDILESIDELKYYLQFIKKDI